MEKFNLARNLFWNSITYNSDPDGSLIASDSNILLIEYMYNWQLFDELKKKNPSTRISIWRSEMIMMISLTISSN